MGSILKDLAERQINGNIEFIEYCRKHIVLDTGIAYDPIGRPCMIEVVDAFCNHPYVVSEKGAQTGISTLAIGYSFHRGDIKKENIIYYLPTDAMCKTFKPTRFDPYVDRSPYLKERIQGTDNAGLMQIGTHFIYVRGLVSKTGAISIPADEIMFDEVALINPENMELAQDRISAPDSLGWQKYFSVALFPADGIDELYQDSDMRQWFIKCGCRYQNPVEKDFPNNFVKKGDEVILACPKCGRALDVANGTWVAEHPDRIERRGYRIPQLIIPGQKLNNIWNRWETAKKKPSKRATFNRSVLALPDSGNMQPVSPEVLERIDKACDYYWQDYSDELTGIGIDMGDQAHVAIVAPNGPEGIRPLAFFQVDVEDLADLTQALESKYNAGALVVDAMPYKTESKRVVRGLKKAQGYIQYFKGDDLKEGTEGEGEKAVNKVSVDRDESLDDTTDLFAMNPPRASLPRPRTAEEEQILKNVKTHLLKLVKEKIGEEDGNTVIRYKKNVSNHFGMALNSARIALKLAIGQSVQTGPTEYTTVETKRYGKIKGAY